MLDQNIKVYKQLKNSLLPYSVDFNRFITAHGLTYLTSTAESDDDNVIISSQSAASGIWNGELEASDEGCAMITVTTTFTGSSIVRIRKFKVEVTDPDC